MADKFLIDFGKDYIVARFGEKQVCERNIGVFEKGDELKLMRAGNAAVDLLQRPIGSSLAVITPFTGEKVAYPKAAELILADIIKREFPKLKKSVEVYVAIRLSLKELHMRAIYDVFKRIGFRDITLLDSLLALTPYVKLAPVAIIGASGSDIGILDEGIIEGCSTSVGGDYLDNLIVKKIEKVYKLRISLAAAEYIKFEVGSLLPSDLLSTKVTGQNVLTGEMLTTTVNTNDIREEVTAAYTRILEIIDSLFTLLPDKMLESIQEKAIYIAGGGANIRGIEHFFQNFFHRSAIVATQPELGIINGMANLAERERTLAALLKLQR